MQPLRLQVEELVTEQYTGSYELVQGETPTATDAVLLVDYSHKVCTLTAADGSASITGTLVDAQDDALTMTLNGSDALTVPITKGEDAADHPRPRRNRLRLGLQHHLLHQRGCGHAGGRVSVHCP